MEKIKKISIENKNYPSLLKKIKNPPKILYYLGEIKEKENCLAIVGARKCTNYGKEMAFKIAQQLAEVGLTVVSGFAPGIDTAAHKGALESKGRTIAVLGTGINFKLIYPKENLKLIEKILELGGAIISEFPPWIHGTKYTFLQRNRIISGLSLGVVVIEAKEKSGALITAEYAFSQNKKVFALPGSVFSLTSKGCHYLIKKKGAKLIEGAEDILEELRLKKETEKKKIEGEGAEESLILKVLEEGAQDIEKIIEKTKLPPQKVAAALSILEIKGKIKNLGGNVFVLNS